MTKFTSALCCGLSAGILLLSCSSVQAQSPRYSAQGIIQAEGEAPLQAAPQVDLQPVPEGQGYEIGPNCQPDGGYCPDGGYGGCPGGCRPGFGFRVRQFFDWFNPHGMCVHSPDHGFCPPAKRPIYSNPVPYQKYYPTAWTGQGYGGAGYQQPVNPAVYWPTDTTQLGYYYQHVPQWQPNPGMYPHQPPQPGNWHQNVCQYGQCNTCRPGGLRFIGTAPYLPYGGQGTCPNCPQGGYAEGGYVDGGYAGGGQDVIQPVPAAIQPVDPQPIPAAPAQ